MRTPRAGTTRTLRSANDEYQLLLALLTNRTKRHRQGRFLVHGVRSINLAMTSGWPIASLLVSDTATSRWAQDLLAAAAVPEIIRMADHLLAELSQREEGAEVVAVAETRKIDVAATDWGEGPVVVAEAVQSPGNLGTILRSADALGATGAIVTGHAADPYDPQCVRASTGALFSVPFAAASSVAEVIDAVPGRAVGLHPDGDVLDDVDLSGRVLLLAGTESTGLSRKAIDACDALASIPMTGTTASLNVATAVSIALAEIARRRRS